MFYSRYDLPPAANVSKEESVPAVCDVSDPVRDCSVNTIEGGNSDGENDISAAPAEPTFHIPNSLEEPLIETDPVTTEAGTGTLITKTIGTALIAIVT